MHGGLSPDLQSMEQIRRVMRPTDVPDTGMYQFLHLLVLPIVKMPPGLLCDLLWSDPDKDITGWSENDRGVSFTFGPDVVSRFLQKHDMDLICRAHQVCVHCSGPRFFRNPRASLCALCRGFFFPANFASFITTLQLSIADYSYRSLKTGTNSSQSVN